MSDVNKVILIGGIVQEPKALGSALKVRLATSRKFTSNGEVKEATEYHDVIIGEKTAGGIGKYLTVGKKIYVEGRIEYRQHEGKYYTDIRAFDVNLLSAPEKSKKAVDNPKTESQYTPDSTSQEAWDEYDAVPF